MEYRRPLGVFSGTSNPELSEQIAEYLKIPLRKATISRFPDGEIWVKIDEDVRGRDIFVVQSTCSPPNENLMELLIFIDTLKRASARRITAVLPYYGYARQDRKDQPRVPITAKLTANLISKAGADRVLTVDLHASQVQGFFDIPVDHLFAVNVLVDYFSKMDFKDLAVVSPDVGGIKMARAYAKKLGAELAIVDKRRLNESSTEVMHIMGDVKGKNAILIDDIIATAGSITEAAAALRKHGCKDIYASVTHPVLSGPAIERIEKSELKEIIVCNTIPLENHKKHPKIKCLSIAPLLGEAIKRIHAEESVSSLFN